MTRALALAFIVALFAPDRASAYSVLAHEATIDVAWDTALRPLLLRKYPATTPDALVRARSFAYGGSVIQDLGYYPFGNKFFSNLLHYVRSGDFVEALVRDARDVDELAFALGALAHYSNDVAGHPGAVNLAVPMVFPKLRAKYGDRITYVQAPKQHVIVEFSFDIVHAASGAYLPEAYRSFIGFRVATPLLERVFHSIYGLAMKDLFGDEERAIATYRYAVSQIVPALTEAAWRDKHDEIVKLMPAVERHAFVFAYRRADFERDYGRDYQKPGLFARFLALLYRLLPKVGPLKPLAFEAPTAEAEKLFADSFRQAAGRFRTAVGDLADGTFEFRNLDFDTGQPPRHGEYALADDTYAELLVRLSKADGPLPSSELRQDVATFYGEQPVPSPRTKYARKHWKQVVRALQALAP